MNPLSLNQKTVNSSSLPEAVAACVRAGIESIGVWREPLREVGVERALDLAERFDQEVVGVVVDTFHVWWDPDLERQLARARGRIASFQVGDWITPLPTDTLLARGMMGDGHIDFRYLAVVGTAGYTGDVEVEIFNADLWRQDADTVLSLVKRRYAETCAS